MSRANVSFTLFLNLHFVSFRIRNMGPKQRFMSLLTLLIITLLAEWKLVTQAQMSSDPRLCGGYQRDARGYIDFRFNENTAPPGIAMKKKFCMWTISPTVPSEHYSYNMTIRNVNLDCDAGDSITINYFNESSDSTNLGWSTPWLPEPPTKNPLCIQPNQVWERQQINGTTMVVILYVEDVTYGKGFYMEWKEGYESRISAIRMRRTYHSFGKPSVAPSPYFAAGFLNNEISTFGFIKANYTDGYVMDMYFTEISRCEGQNDWMNCFENTYSIFKVEDDGKLTLEQQFKDNQTLTPAISSSNGFFIIVKIEDDKQSRGGGRFTMVYDTVRG